VKLILFDGYGTLFDQAMETLYETCQVVVNDFQLDMAREAFLAHWEVFLRHSTSAIRFKADRQEDPGYSRFNDSFRP